MTDDVDVNECPHLIEDYQWWNIAGQEEHDINRCALSFDEYIDFEEDDFCKENHNCYFKQLKRKEQECEELNNTITNLENTKEELLTKIDQLKAELEKYKPILDRLLKQFETYDKLKSLDVVTFAKQTFDQLDQLKHALQEIKELTIEAKTKQFVDMEDFWEQILQKCEVIKE